MVRKILKSVGEYKKATVMTMLLVVFEVAIDCVIPFIIATLINQIEAGCGLDVIVKWGIVLVVLAFFSLLFGAWAGSTCATASAGFARNLRRNLFHRVQDFSFENIDRFSSASLVTRMTTDVSNVQMAFMMIIRTAIRSPLMIIFSFIMAFALGGSMAIIYAVLIPFLGFFLFLIIRKVTPLFTRVFRKYDRLNESIEEDVRGMRVVKSFVREDHEREKFGRASDDVCRDFTRAEKILAFNNPLMQFCLYALMVVVIFFGSRKIVSVGGEDVRKYDLEVLRNQVAVVLQKNVLFSGTIKENLRWGNPDATDAELEEACRLAQADEFITQFPDGYDTHIEQGGTNVSGGQKQRLCIARALLKKPKILILDDSTSAVDTKTDALIRMGFKKYIPTTTKIIIAQRLSSVQDADRILILDGGRIAAIGSHEELLADNELYREIWHSQNRGSDKTTEGGDGDANA